MCAVVIIGPCNSGSAKVLSHGGERGPQMSDIVKMACALSALSFFISLLKCNKNSKIDQSRES